MTTGEGVRGEEGRMGRVGGHKKMATALSHLLSAPAEKEINGVRDGNVRVRKRKRPQKKVSEDEDDVSNAGDVVACCRRLPDASNIDRERRLQRIATTGVVQLFNAVSQHTRETQAKVKAASSERKKAKVLSTVDKGSFIDLLKGRRSDVKGRRSEVKGRRSEVKDRGSEVKDRGSEGSKWAALKEDYMLGAKMRDWQGDKDEGDQDEGGKDEGDQDEGEQDGEDENRDISD